MNEWTAEANEAIRMCEEWAAKVAPELSCRLFLFGSAIYKGGEQFDREHSDLDIVCLFPEYNTAVTRLNALKILHRHKADLELQMVRVLSRTTCTEPGISIVPITEFELHVNIHKSGARSFFTKNFFYNLVTKEETLGIPEAGTRTMQDEYRQALEYVQKIRNEYLAVSANGKGGLGDFRGADPIPKALLRAAAQLNPDAADGEWYDTRLGLELIHEKLRKNRSDDDAFKKLFDRVSVRRGGRGHKTILFPEDQLLLTELLFEIGTTGTTEQVVTWEIRLSNSSGSPVDETSAFALVKRLVHDAQLIGIRRGSVIMRVRSSISGYHLLADLERFGVLANVFSVENAELARIDADPLTHERSQDDSRERHLLDLISGWRPQGTRSWFIEENNFAKYIQEAMEADQRLKGALVMRNVQADKVEVPYEMDFLLSWANSDGSHERVGIDLSHIRSQSHFLHKISQLLPLGRTIVLVAVGRAELLEKMKPDIERLALLNANVRVVPIATQD